jgi:hypothetical protein
MVLLVCLNQKRKDDFSTLPLSILRTRKFSVLKRIEGV